MEAAFSARLLAGCVFSGGHLYNLRDGLWGLDELGEPEVMKVESSIVRTEAVRGLHHKFVIVYTTHSYAVGFF